MDVDDNVQVGFVAMVSSVGSEHVLPILFETTTRT